MLRDAFFAVAICGCMANAVSQVVRVLGTTRKLPPNEVGSWHCLPGGPLLISLGFSVRPVPCDGHHHVIGYMGAELGGVTLVGSDGQLETWEMEGE